MGMTHTVGMALPSTKRLRDLLEAQVDREVHVQPTVAASPTLPGLSFGIYVAGRLATHAIAVLDLAGAVYLGAARALVPVNVAATAVQERRLSPLLATNVRALLEQWSELFVLPPGSPPVRLYQAVLPGETAPADVVSLAAAPGRRLDLTVSVHGYGDGGLSLVLGR